VFRCLHCIQLQAAALASLKLVFRKDSGNTLRDRTRIGFSAPCWEIVKKTIDGVEFKLPQFKMLHANSSRDPTYLNFEALRWSHLMSYVSAKWTSWTTKTDTTRNELLVPVWLLAEPNVIRCRVLPRADNAVVSELSGTLPNELKQNDKDSLHTGAQFY
jgi:hypothetical protein